jgi:hypothetical protein
MVICDHAKSHGGCDGCPHANPHRQRITCIKSHCNITGDRVDAKCVDILVFEVRAAILSNGSSSGE